MIVRQNTTAFRGPSTTVSAFNRFDVEAGHRLISRVLGLVNDTSPHACVARVSLHFVFTTV